MVYTPSNSVIYLNGSAITGLGGLNNIMPPQTILDQGLFLGSDNSGGQRGGVTLDLLETFNYPLSALQITTDYSNAWYFADVDRDGAADGWERQYFGNVNQTTSGDYDGDGLSYYFNLERSLEIRLNCFASSSKNSEVS